MAAMLGAVRSVDLVVEGGVGVRKTHVFVDDISLDVAFARETEPFGVIGFPAVLIDLAIVSAAVVERKVNGELRTTAHRPS